MNGGYIVSFQMGWLSKLVVPASTYYKLEITSFGSDAVMAGRLGKCIHVSNFKGGNGVYWFGDWVRSRKERFVMCRCDVGGEGGGQRHCRARSEHRTSSNGAFKLSAYAVGRLNPTFELDHVSAASGMADVTKGERKL